MVASASTVQHLLRKSNIGMEVAGELHEADARRFGRISVRGLFCGFVELDGVVTSYYAKALALQIARRVPEVNDVVDLIRIVPDSPDRSFQWRGV